MRVVFEGSVKTDILDELDLKQDALCTLRFITTGHPFCEQPAQWACRLGCCGQVKVVCGDHRDIVNSVLPRLFVCGRCHAVKPMIASVWPI